MPLTGLYIKSLCQIVVIFLLPRFSYWITVYEGDIFQTMVPQHAHAHGCV